MGVSKENWDSVKNPKMKWKNPKWNFVGNVGKIFNNLRALEITLKWLFICFCGRMAVSRFLFTFCETFSSMHRKEKKFWENFGCGHSLSIDENRLICHSVGCFV